MDLVTNFSYDRRSWADHQFRVKAVGISSPEQGSLQCRSWTTIVRYGENPVPFSPQGNSNQKLTEQCGLMHEHAWVCVWERLTDRCGKGSSSLCSTELHSMGVPSTVMWRVIYGAGWASSVLYFAHTWIQWPNLCTSVCEMVALTTAVRKATTARINWRTENLLDFNQPHPPLKRQLCTTIRQARQMVPFELNKGEEKINESKYEKEKLF